MGPSGAVQVASPKRPDAKHSAGVITRWAGVEWLDTHEPELVELETVDEHVDCQSSSDAGNTVLCPRSNPSGYGKSRYAGPTDP
jgi:hypothetical protein